MGRYIPDWRHIYVLSSIIVVPFLLLWFVPETPYYLINKDLKKRCKRVLLGFAKKNAVKTDEKELEKVIQNIPVETDTENLSPKLLFTYSKELTWITTRYHHDHCSFCFRLLHQAAAPRVKANIGR